ncbi:MAG TPA: LacI family DNA-binding transcriptional regulator [Opitutaceae bacterium]|jgi:LacI family transcriptional regulator|nr:LacI family DNA-binding transcriptional regulator [Opitutaceae bacterium]
MGLKPGSKTVVTIYQIAEYVGMSPAAVSSVLANRHVERRISEESAKRVREAARTLGYVPNMAGRRLRAHPPAMRQIDLAILTSFEAPLPIVSQALQALQKAADAETNAHTRFAVGIEMFHAGRLREKPGLLDGNRYHGVIITNTLPADDEFLASAQFPYAAVVLGRRIPNLCCVLEVPDVVGRRSAEVLVEIGCRHPVVLHGRMLTQATAERVAAFKRGIQEALGRKAIALECADLRPASAAMTLTGHLSRRRPCDGVFTVTDSLAVGAYRAISTAGKRIPHDIAVVGVGDYELAEFFSPPLSTLAGANDAMVAQAVPLLFRLLRGEPEATREILVVPSVFLRESTRRG